MAGQRAMIVPGRHVGRITGQVYVPADVCRLGPRYSTFVRHQKAFISGYACTCLRIFAGRTNFSRLMRVGQCDVVGTWLVDFADPNGSDDG